MYTVFLALSPQTTNGLLGQVYFTHNYSLLTTNETSTLDMQNTSCFHEHSQTTTCLARPLRKEELIPNQNQSH